MTKPCSPPTASSSPTSSVLDRRAISARLRRMGLLISEVPKHARTEVRAWVASLSDADVALLAGSAEAISTHDAELAGKRLPRDVKAALPAFPSHLFPSP